MTKYEALKCADILSVLPAVHFNAAKGALHPRRRLSPFSITSAFSQHITSMWRSSRKVKCLTDLVTTNGTRSVIGTNMGQRYNVWKRGASMQSAINSASGLKATTCSCSKFNLRWTWGHCKAQPPWPLCVWSRTWSGLTVCEILFTTLVPRRKGTGGLCASWGQSRITEISGIFSYAATARRSIQLGRRWVIGNNSAPSGADGQGNEDGWIFVPYWGYYWSDVANLCYSGRVLSWYM